MIRKRWHPSTTGVLILASVVCNGDELLHNREKGQSSHPRILLQIKCKKNCKLTSASFLGCTPIHLEALILALFNKLRAL